MIHEFKGNILHGVLKAETKERNLCSEDQVMSLVVYSGVTDSTLK